MDSQNYKCPLCGSILERDRWVKITGKWDELEQEKANTKRLLEKSKKEKVALEKKHQIERKKIIKQAEMIGIAKGIKKEKNQTERMAKMISKQTKDLTSANQKIQVLEKQLKEGTTPQLAGFDYEKEVQRMLSESFPEDRIKPTGKKGDVIQYVVFNKEEIGSILYECKKTEKYSNQFVQEIKKHQEKARADYSIVVTHAQKKGKSSFFIDNNIVVIDPLGLLDMAFLLRNMIIDIHRMKLTKEESKKKGMQILRYMQSGEFKNNMVSTIEKSKQAYELLLKEVNDHKKNWTERRKIYYEIHETTQAVRGAIGQIITGNPVKLESYSFHSIGSNEILKLEDKT